MKHTNDIYNYTLLLIYKMMILLEELYTCNRQNDYKWIIYHDYKWTMYHDLINELHIMIWNE